MALLWWIGATANGDVNVAGNWSYYGPGSYQAGYTALVPATNIPKYNDIITFDKFVPKINGIDTVYPLYGPTGDMNGICGPAGATAAQYFQEVRINPGFPKTIGGSTAFAFRTSSLIIKRGITGTLANDYSNTHRIHLRDCSGVTKINANINIDSTIKENYSIQGVAGQLSVGMQYGTDSNRVPYANVYLNDLELQGRTFTQGDPQSLSKLNAALLVREFNVTYDNSLTGTAQVFVHLYPTTTVLNDIYLEGKEKLVIFRGFNLSSNTLYAGSVFGTIDIPAYSQIEFRSDANSSFTGTGADYATRSYIYKMNMVGDAIVIDSKTAYLPKLIMDHGVDINELDFKGTGQVTTNNEQIGDAARILRGRFDFAAHLNAASQDESIYSPKMGFYSDIDNISFGPSGQFIWKNLPSASSQQTNYLRSNLRGTWAYKITPTFSE